MTGKKKTALICGMAKSGIASAILLYRNGYNVTINDMKAEIPGLEQALSHIEYKNELGKDPETLLEGVDLLVLSPVIPIFKPFALSIFSAIACAIGLRQVFPVHTNKSFIFFTSPIIIT